MAGLGAIGAVAASMQFIQYGLKFGDRVIAAYRGKSALADVHRMALDFDVENRKFVTSMSLRFESQDLTSSERDLVRTAHQCQEVAKELIGITVAKSELRKGDIERKQKDLARLREQCQEQLARLMRQAAHARDRLELVVRNDSEMKQQLTNLRYDIAEAFEEAVRLDHAALLQKLMYAYELGATKAPALEGPRVPRPLEAFDAHDSSTAAYHLATRTTLQSEDSSTLARLLFPAQLQGQNERHPRIVVPSAGQSTKPPDLPRMASFTDSQNVAGDTTSHTHEGMLPGANLCRSCGSRSPHDRPDLRSRDSDAEASYPVVARMSIPEKAERNKNDTVGTSHPHSQRWWTTPEWLEQDDWLDQNDLPDQKMDVEAFCSSLTVHNGSMLNQMIDNDNNIKLSIAELTILVRSKSFYQGAKRAVHSACTSASSLNFVVKNHLGGQAARPKIFEDMRIRAVCKAFALEFNTNVRCKPPLDFLTASYLEISSEQGHRGSRDCLSLERLLDGEWVKYNSNAAYINEDVADDSFCRMAQAFSHFTFERSCGSMLVNNLQGSGHLLTGPTIQTKDPERFKLADTNLGVDGFKFCFAMHKCNKYCRKLQLESTKEMLISGKYEFRQMWPTIDPVICCSNMLCRSIVRLVKARKSGHHPGHHWCKRCFAQLRQYVTTWICIEPGPKHNFLVNEFFHESQGERPPRRRPDHREKPSAASNARSVGASLWNATRAAIQEDVIPWPGSNHDPFVDDFFYESQSERPPRGCPDDREQPSAESSEPGLRAALWSATKAGIQAWREEKAARRQAEREEI